MARTTMPDPREFDPSTLPPLNPGSWGGAWAGMSRFPQLAGPYGSTVLNASGLPDGLVMDDQVLADDAVASMIQRVYTDLTAERDKYTLHDRTNYNQPGSELEAMRVARIAARDDDIFSAWVDESESLAFTDMSVFSGNEDEEDVWDQIMRDIKIEVLARKCWQRLDIDSQCVVLARWEPRTYRTRLYGKDGRPRRLEYTLTVPTRLAVLDTTRIIPVGELTLGEERLAYQATAEEAARIEAALRLPVVDEAEASWVTPWQRAQPLIASSPDLIKTMFVGRYPVTADEARLLQDDGIGEIDYLYLLRADTTWRHTLTKGDFDRFATVRARSLLKVLDLKQKVMHTDRVMLAAGANFIVLVTKGTDQHPADQKEIANLRDSSEELGVRSVVVGDHRLDIRIITPALDLTLNAERYNVLNDAIKQRLTQTVMPGGDKATDPMKTARLVAAGLESRRDMLGLAFETNIIDEILRRNPTAFGSEATLLFSPDTVQLVFDPAFASAIADLRMIGDLSRRTGLSQFGINARREKLIRIREARPSAGDDYEADTEKLAAALSDDEVHKTSIPYSGAMGGGGPNDGSDPAANRVASRFGGRAGGGNRAGGGSAPDTNQGGAIQNDPLDPRKSEAAAAADPLVYHATGLLEALGYTITAPDTEAP